MKLMPEGTVVDADASPVWKALLLSEGLAVEVPQALAVVSLEEDVLALSGEERVFEGGPVESVE